VHDDPGGFQVATDGLAPDGERLLDAPQRPSESAERENLLLLVVVQDVAHPGEGLHVHHLRQRLNRYKEWPVFSCRLMAGFGCPPRKVLLRFAGRCEQSPDRELDPINIASIDDPDDASVSRPNRIWMSAKGKKRAKCQNDFPAQSLT
jgi:hypothetical protein